jgi:signal transduction histidine kinase
MKLKTQFAILTLAVTLLPMLFTAVFFGVQQAPRDPRVPTRQFLESLAVRWRESRAISIDLIEKEAKKADIPLKEVAIISPDGLVIASTFPHLAAGDRIELRDLAPPSPGSSVKLSRQDLNPGRVSRDTNGGKPEFRLQSIDPGSVDSPLILFDIQPFWSRQDIKNRNLLYLSGFSLLIFIVAGVLSLFILKSISEAIKKIEKDTAIVATGDLDHEVAGSGNHEIFMLAKSINLMRLNLKDMLLRRSKMLMGVSHDLKTPLALIQGYADALADDVAVDEETRSKYIRIIQTKARQLEDLTGEILDVLQIGADGSIAVEEVDLAQFMRRLGERFSSDALLLKRRLEWGFGEDARPAPPFPLKPLSMNRLLVERAIENLVTNSFKYSREDSLILLRLLLVEGKPAISVLDEGNGIAQEDAPYVFDAFFRGSHSRADGGHGFGLTVVKAAAELHGWKVTLGPRSDGKPGTEALFVMS